MISLVDLFMIQLQFSDRMWTWNFTENSLIFYIKGFVYNVCQWLFSKSFSSRHLFSKIGIAYTCTRTCARTHIFCIMLGLIIKMLSNLFYLSAYSSGWLFWIEIFAHWCIEIRKIIYLWALNLFLRISEILQSPDPDHGKLGKMCDFVFWITVRITYTITTNFF